MSITKLAVQMALIDWAKSKDRVTVTAAEEFVAATLAGLKKINLEFEDLRLVSSEDREGTAQR